MSHKTWRTIEFSLNTGSIRKAIREVQACKAQLREAMDKLIEELATQGAEVARMQVASFDAVDTGELHGSIYGYYDPKSRIGYVIAGAAHAIYVEYGTGPIGEVNTHPEYEKIGWEYNVGETIGLHPKHPEWGEGWYYPGDDGKAHWTSGQPARPFMYNTMVWLEEAAEALGAKIFS